jgi:hypothetical protein
MWRVKNRIVRRNEMEEFEKIKSMLKDADTLKRSNEIYSEKIHDKSCDKHGFEFSTYDKFVSINLSVNLNSWRGYYGNSGCSTIFSFQNGNEVKEAFEKYLNIHRTEILKWMGEYIYNKVIKEKEKAEKELQEGLDFLNNIKPKYKEEMK